MVRRLVTVNLDHRDAGLMVDISEAGMAVQALSRIKQGAKSSLHFQLPDSATRIEATGTVAWVDATSGRAGIHFDSLPDASAAALKEWLRLNEPQAAVPAPAVTATTSAPALPASRNKAAEIAALRGEIAAQGLGRDAALALAIERVRVLTRADGVAIVLGDSSRMKCCASSGSAPPVGAELQPDSGISGECVRTGVTVCCEHTELDPRVNREACSALNLRSAVIVPLFARGKISGLVEVFYAVPRGFDSGDVLTLRQIADLISSTFCGSVSGEPRSPLQVPHVASSGPPSNPVSVCSTPPAPKVTP